MGFTMRGDKNSLALLSSKRIKAYSRSRADEAFALPSFSDAMPAPAMEPPWTSNNVAYSRSRADEAFALPSFSDAMPAPAMEPPRTSNTAAETQPEQHHMEPEHCPVEHDSENVKQTMLQHESVFKEQLHELHRLYQKQCLLMLESQKGHACQPRSEPPSSNSSLLHNPELFKSQEDESFGNAGVTKASDNDAFPTQLLDAKPFEAAAEHRKQSCDRPMLDLEHPLEGRPMLDLERPPDNCPIFDLERSANEYMEVEMGKEKPPAMGLMCAMADASVIDKGENGDVVSGKNSDSRGRKRWDFCTSYERGDADADGMSKDARGSKDRKCEGCFQLGDLGHQCADSKEDCWSPMDPSSKVLDWSHQKSVSLPMKAASASGLFQGLPDLNGEPSAADNQTSVVERKLEKSVNDCQYIDLEADSRTFKRSSKLPHWLVQPPPKASRMSLPTSISAQTSEWQQTTTFFDSNVHHTSNLRDMHTRPARIIKTSELQEPYHPWLLSKMNSQQREISFKEPLGPPSLQFLSGASSGVVQRSYDGARTSGLANESISSFLPYARDNNKMGTVSASGVLSSPYMERQDVGLDTQAASVERLSRISSRENMALSPVLPWYPQKGTFSSLIHQASNPEPPFHRPSHASSVNPWGDTSSHHQVLPITCIDNMERGVYGMHSFGSNFEDPCRVARSESLIKDPVFDFMSSNSEHGCTQDLCMKGNAATWKEVERPFCAGQIAEKARLSNNDCNLGPTRNAFDLNVACESCPMEESFDACYFTKNRCHANEKQAFKQECETVSHSDWDILRGNKAAHLNEEQKGLQAPGFANMETNEVMASEVSNRGATQSLNDTTFFTRAGMFCSQRERCRNDTCADNCSGEDEGGFVEVKSSDASGLTSCESRDAAHTKVRDDSNTSSGEACQSRESRIPCYKEDVALSSNVQSKRISGNGMVESQQWGSYLFSTMQRAPGYEMKGECLVLVGTEFDDESEAANSIARRENETADSVVREHSIEVAELLLSLGCDLPPVAEEGYAINVEGKSLDWLANIIPQEGNCDERVLDVVAAGTATHEDGSSRPCVVEKVMDAFELAVLALKPIDPNSECLTTQVMERGSLVENCPSLPNLRRRSSRRGRAGKDFQREMLQSMSSLSRHEITEDLQIIEGLIKSTTDATNTCALVPEDDKPSSSPDLGCQKKARVTKACRGRKPSGMWNVCSWGESTRRKRMGRQRSQWSCLLPAVQSSLFVANNIDSGLA